MAKYRRAKNHKRAKKLRRLLLAVLVGFAVVLFWRSAWGLMDLYLFPNDPFLSYIIPLFVSLGILYASHYLIKELLGDKN